MKYVPTQSNQKVVFSVGNVAAISKFQAPLWCKDDRLAWPPFCSVWPTKPESFAFVLIGLPCKGREREEGKRTGPATVV